jgi:ABC-2 type transport system ATP-binding protein
MDHGKIIALGTPGALIASLGAEHVIEFALADGASGGAPHDLPDAMRALTGVTAVRPNTLGAASASLTVTELHRTLPALLALLQQRRLELSSLTTHHATLDDVFVALTGRQLRDT